MTLKGYLDKCVKFAYLSKYLFYCKEEKRRAVIFKSLP